MSDHHEKPVRVIHPETTRWSLTTAAIVSLLAVIASAVVVWAGDHFLVNEHAREIPELQVRVRVLEDRMAGMVENVKWIRDTMEREQDRNDRGGGKNAR